ncbi:MAG: AmmeMemoRadiSam system radical SAM enzyme [Candidatus Woesearchaeota archaeon]
MHEAMYYNKLEDHKVKCTLCPWNCIIKNEKYGVCKVKKNVDGKLVSIVYGKPIGMHADPIEKKPLFHFLPGKAVYSFGTFGCNFFCIGCQNYEMSKEWEEEQIAKAEISPECVVELAKKEGCEMIAFTYNEPIIFYEYMLDVAKTAKKRRIKCIMVSNGYINTEPLQELIKYIDAANIDLKGFSEEFYKKWTKGKLAPVLETIKTLRKADIWIEITTLIIPKENDNPVEIEKMCKWIKENIGNNVPLHFSRFFPMYKAEDKIATPIVSLLKLKKIANKYLNYVYIGNVYNAVNVYGENNNNFENTICPECKNILVNREGYRIIKNKIKNGKCSKCNTEIKGVWK